MLGVLEEDVIVGTGAIEVEEADIETMELGRVEIGEAVRGNEIEVSRCKATFALGREKDSYASDEEGLGKALYDGVEQSTKVGLGVEAATELDEGFAVVKAFLIEDSVHARLNGTLERIEDDSGDDDGGEQSPDAEIGESGVDHLAGQRNDAKVNSDERCGSEGVGNAAFEDEVDVHEPVADDRPAKGKGKNDERETGGLRYLAVDRPVCQVGDDVEQGERSDGDEGAAREPLELLALQSRLGPTIAEAEDDGGDDVVEGKVSECDLIESMKKDLGRRPEADGRVLQANKEDPRQIEQHTTNAAAQAFALVRGEVVGEAYREVKEECRLECLRSHVSPIDKPVKGARFAGGSEAVEDEGSKAEDVEMNGLWGGPAAEENVDADAKVDQRDEAKTLIDGAVFGFENDLNVEPCGAI